MEEETKTAEEPQAEETPKSGEPAQDKARQKAEEIGKPLEKMTAPELREVAVLIEGVTGASAMKKEDLVALIKEAWGIADEEPAARKKATKTGATLQELKAKIARFKQEKQAAKERNDRQQVEVLRRRINRLKKQTRKAARA
jgi:molybdopterin converting factor small subunit